jgi:hypothetical protein
VRTIISFLALAAILWAPPGSLAQSSRPDMDGARPNSQTSLGLLNDVFGVSATSVYAVGANGAILHFDGQFTRKMILLR